MTPQRVTLIKLGMDDLEQAKTFYANLGWKAAKAREGVVFCQMNGAVLGLFWPGLELARDQGRPGADLCM